MNSIELLLANFNETRRRSLKLWHGLPEESYHWKPDAGAMSCLEMIRHVLEAEHLFHVIIKNGGNLGSYQSPWAGLPLLDLNSDLYFAEPFRQQLMTEISCYSEADLTEISIERTEKGQPPRRLGDYLNRMIYHESVHTGQMMSYLRTYRAEIPVIWD